MANPKTNQKVVATVTFTKADGSPGTVDGTPAWTSSNPAAGTIMNVSTDGMTAEMHGTGAAGSTTMMAEADADLGAGSRPIQLTAVVLFEDTEVTGGTLEVSEPVDI